MPFPKNFTKTKWLAFFAELSSKISHHSPSVLVEGAELLRRLLMTQLGIAAFLEESSLLHQMCDTIESLLNASGRQFQGLLSSDTEAAISLLQVLSEVISLSIALFNEKDSYYSLLVMSRMDSTVLKMLCTVLRSHIVDTPVTLASPNSASFSPPPNANTASAAAAGDADFEGGTGEQFQQQQQQAQAGAYVYSTSTKTKQSPFFGFALSLVQILVSALPLANFSVDVESIVPAEAHHHLPNSAAVRHVRSMESLCRGEAGLMELRDTIDTLIAAQISTDEGNATTLALRSLHSQLIMCLSVSQGNNNSRGHADISEEAKDSQIRRAVTKGFDMIRSAKGHASVHLGLNVIWCCLVADGNLTSKLLDNSKLSCLERFCRTEPHTVEDLALFRSLLAFFSALCHVVDETPTELQRFLIEIISPSVISHIRVSSSSSSSSNSNSPNNRNNNNNMSNHGHSHQLQHEQCAAEGGLGTAANATFGSVKNQTLSTTQFLRAQGSAPVEPVQRPSPTLSILQFLHVVLTSCRALRGDDVSRWVRAQGLFLRLVNLLESCGSTASPLLEAPFAADGTLPDELFLQAALATCRTDTATSASVSLKLLTELLLNFGGVLAGFSSTLASSATSAASQQQIGGNLSTEVSALVKAALPVAVRIAAHHPTMSISRSQQTSLSGGTSILHYVPQCSRSTRPCSVGEAALLALDTLVTCALQIEIDTSEVILTFETISPWLPNLVRSTKDSVLPHLRTTVHRLLVRVCRNVSSLRSLVQILPSFTTNAAEIVLNQTSTSPSSSSSFGGGQQQQQQYGRGLNNNSFDWEVAGAALWLSAVLRIASNSEQQYSFGQSPNKQNQKGDNNNIAPIDMLLVPALPRNLLLVASSMPPSYGSGALLQLLGALAERHHRFHQTSLSSNEEASIAKILAGHTTAPDLVGSVVAPDGSASVATWTQLLESFTTMCTRPELCPFGGDEIRSVTDDAVFRARGAMEEQTARTWYAAQLFHAVSILVERHRDLQRAIPVDVLCNAVGTLLSSPLPSEIRSSLENKYAVSLPKPTQLLEITDEAIRSGVSLLRIFFDPAGVQQGVLPGVSKQCLDGLCAVLASVELAPRTRSLAASFLNDILANPSQTQPIQSVEQYAASCFLATRKVNNNNNNNESSSVPPAIFGLRCRLVTLFEAANHSATSGGWFKECVKRLSNVVQAILMQHRGSSSSSTFHTSVGEIDQAEVQFALSGISSILAFPQCLPVDRADCVSCASSLLSLLKMNWAQPVAIHACRALANSSEGRAVLSCDLPSASSSSSSPASPLSQRLSQIHNNNNNHKDAATSLIRAPFAKLVEITFSGKLPSLEDVTCGTDAVSCAVLRDPEAFSPWLIKFKVLDSVNSMLVLCARQKMTAPLAIYRFLASATAAEDMRIAVAHNSEIVELITDAAEQVSPHGTLALMTLRNLTFSNALKNQICTNDAALNLFKRVLWLLGSNADYDSAPSPTSSSSPLSPHNQNTQQQLQLQKKTSNSRKSSVSRRSAGPKTAEEVMMQHAGNLDLFRRQELAASAFWSLVDGNQRAKSFIRNILSKDQRRGPCTLDEVRSQLSSIGSLSDLPGYPQKVVATIDILESHGLGQHQSSSSSSPTHQHQQQQHHHHQHQYMASAAAATTAVK